MEKAQLYWESIKASVKNPFFLVFLVSLFTIWTNGGSSLDMITAVLAFVGVKTVVNLGTNTSEADKQFTMTEHFFLSSRTWVAVFGLIFCYYVRMPEEMKQILIALAGGFGLDQIGVAIKGINFNKFVRPMNITVTPSLPAPQPPIYLPPVDPPVVPPLIVPEPIPVVTLLKDKIALIREYYSKGKNYREYFRGAIGATINKWLQHMTQVNPNVTSVEMAQEIADKFFGRKLTTQECATIQGILGLESIIKSMGDAGILESFFTAFDKFSELAYLENIFRNAAIAQSTVDTINEASGRAKAGDKDIKKARLALMEFGVPYENLNKTTWSGNTISAIYLGNSPENFDPYAIVGFTPEGQPVV